ncbi:MAG: hypothetical protein OXE05_12115 [Chloroflexi bacterium]|nr:hypothetical protein [Chloroflexota bacterium]
MRPVSRLLSVLLALILLGASLLTVSAHSTPEDDDDYGVSLSITRTDDKTTMRVGTVLTFNVILEVTGEHEIPCPVTLTSVTAGGIINKQLCATGSIDRNTPAINEEVKYTVRSGDLGPAERRIAPIQFRISFAPTHSGDNPHSSVTIRSNREFVTVTRTAEDDSDDSSEIALTVTMEPPRRIAKGEKVTFRMTMTTGKYALRSTRNLRIRKQLYDENGDKIGGQVTAKSFFVRPLRTESTGLESTQTYTLTQKDVDAATIEFSYEFEIEDSHLRYDDGSPPDLDSDFEEVFENTWVLGEAATPTATSTPTIRPTPAPRVIGRTSAVTVTELSRYLIRLDRRDGGADFNLNLGWLLPNGTRHFTRTGYIRDNDIYRGGQTYAVVRRESDHEVVRIWISPESPERYDVPWAVVNHPPFTVPVRILSAIKLDESRPVENQLVRRFDAGGDGRIHVYRDGAWRWIPDIPTFQSEGFFWCDVTAADADFFSRARALIGTPLPASGGVADPNYPSCHSK